ncbi:hypothetical protein Bca4012_038936 [Brassica carinata]
MWSCSALSLSDVLVVLWWYSMPVVEAFWSALVSLYEAGSSSLFLPLGGGFVLTKVSCGE